MYGNDDPAVTSDPSGEFWCIPATYANCVLGFQFNPGSFQDGLEVKEFFRRNGFTPVQAAGIAGGLAEESNDFSDCVGSDCDETGEAGSGPQGFYQASQQDLGWGLGSFLFSGLVQELQWVHKTKPRMSQCSSLSGYQGQSSCWDAIQNNLPLQLNYELTFMKTQKFAAFESSTRDLRNSQANAFTAALKFLQYIQNGPKYGPISGTSNPGESGGYLAEILYKGSL